MDEIRTYEALKRQEAENMNQALAFFGQGSGARLSDAEYEKAQEREAEASARALSEAKACEDFFGGSVLNAGRETGRQEQDSGPAYWSPGRRLAESNRKSREDRAARSLYSYNGEPSVNDGRILKPGDILYRLPDEAGQAKFVSSRGVVLNYPGQSLARELDGGGLAQLFPDGASRSTLQSATEKACRQSMYMDADIYKKAVQGRGATAFYNLNGGDDMTAVWCSVEHGRDGFTLARDMSGKYAAGESGDYHDFNPEGMPVVPLSDRDMSRLEDMRREAARPVNRMLRMAGIARDPVFEAEPIETAVDYILKTAPHLDLPVPVHVPRSGPSEGLGQASPDDGLGQADGPDL